MASVLVTGGAGFIGSHLVDELVRLGHVVEVIDNLEPQVHRIKPDYLNPGARYHFRDIREKGSASKVLRDVDIVFHFASIVGVGQSMHQIAHYIDSNVGGTARFLQGLVDEDHGVKKLVIASSASVYGEGTYECPSCGIVHPPARTRSQLLEKEWEVNCPTCASVTKPTATNETKPLAPSSVYAVTKRGQEDLCLVTGRAYGIPTVALRFFNVYGPRQSVGNPYTGVCSIFQSRIKNDKPPVLFEDGAQTRDFVSVHDIVRACLLAVEKKSADFEAINIGSGCPTSVIEVAELLLKLYGSKLHAVAQLRYRPGDVRHCYADISKARGLLAYEPKVRFEQGIQELVEWGKSAPSTDRFPEAYDEPGSSGFMED